MHLLSRLCAAAIALGAPALTQQTQPQESQVQVTTVLAQPGELSSKVQITERMDGSRLV